MVYVNSVKIDESIIYLTLNDVFYNPRVIISPSDATCPYVEWSTSHPDVVSVDPASGNIRALKTGTALVYATAADGSGVRDHIMVRVQEGAVTNINVIESHLVLPINGSGLLHLDLTPSTATYADITWESTKPNVASVTNGVVCANSLGSTIIYARATGSYSIFDTCYVTVTSVENPVTSITLNHLYATKPVNTTFSLIATVTPSNATNNRIEWASSNPNVATVDQNGCVTTKREGGTTITASSTDGGGVVAHCSVQVIPVPVTGIELSEEEVIIKVGETKTLQATVLPADAANKAVTWCSCNEDIVYVNNGVINARGIGTTTIIAASVDGNYTASCTVRVVLDNVTIKRIGGDTDVIFESTGKRWKCIFEDMVYNEQNAIDDRLLPRANFNLFVDPNSRPLIYNFRYFSPAELKLLFAIDPLGVARYIQQYIDLTYHDLGEKLQKKDEFFELFFNCKPRYYTLNDDGEWVQTIYNNNPEDVISESESYFGIHSIGEIDGVRVLVNLVEFGAYIFSLISKSEIVDDLIEIGAVLLKISIYAYNENYEAARNELEEYIQDTISGYIQSEESLSMLIEPVYDFLSALNNINEIMDALSNKQMYYCATIDYCVKKVDYAVRIELQNGNTYQLSQINDLIS